MKLYIRSHYLAAVIAVASLVFGLGATTPVSATERGAILVLGDSLSAGYGLEREQGWVHLLQMRLGANHPGYEVLNASISGDTSRGGEARLPKVLERRRIAVAIVELGGNDGLRGIRLSKTRKHLGTIVAQLKAHGARVLLAGMQIPPNLGPRYTREFQAIYPELASAHDIALVPFFLAGVAKDGTLMQADGIHPTAAAQPRLLDNVWAHLEPLL
jgi:acyl-CoA thioesterase I